MNTKPSLALVLCTILLIGCSSEKPQSVKVRESNPAPQNKAMQTDDSNSDLTEEDLKPKTIEKHGGKFHLDTELKE